MTRTGLLADTLERLLAILRHIPRAPRQIDTATLQAKLEDEGFRTSRRSLQRDLERLATRFPSLSYETEGRRFKWSWDGQGPSIELPGMGLPAAITLEMVRLHLLNVLPRSTAKNLAPYFDRAGELLRLQAGSAASRWPSKVRVVPRGIERRPPPVSPSILDAVSEALLEERRLAVTYRPRGDGRAKEYELGPLGLVLRDGVFVLVATAFAYEDPLHFHLDRMVKATALPTKSKRPAGFDLDAYLAKGGGGFVVGGEPIRLRLLVDADLVPGLVECPVSDDQKLVEDEGGRWRLDGTLPDTLELRGWIKSYAAAITVLKPVGLAREIAGELAAAAARYRTFGIGGTKPARPESRRG
jgi:predicted DNA-binding transcriptional regulator YafY